MSIENLFPGLCNFLSSLCPHVVEKNGERAKVKLQGRAEAICQQGQAAVSRCLRPLSLSIILLHLFYFYLLHKRIFIVLYKNTLPKHKKLFSMG
jgi:hypothetical protein